MKKTVISILILGAIVLAFFAFQKESCHRCWGSGTQKITTKSTCNVCKGRTTTRCTDSKGYESRRFLNNNLDVSYYDCKGGVYRTRKGYANYFGMDGKTCEECNGSGVVDCWLCGGYGYRSVKDTIPHEYCNGTGTVFAYKKWFD